MKTLDWEKYGRVMDEFEFALSYIDLSVDDAFEECDNVDDVIDYILYYYGEYHFGDDRSAILWLRDNVAIADYYMRDGELKDCKSIFELADKALCLCGKEKLLTVKDEIQEQIELFRQSDDDDDDDDDDDEYDDDEY